MKNFKELEELVWERKNKRKLLVVAAEDLETLVAVEQASKGAIVEPVLFGRKEAIKEIIDRESLDLPNVEIVNTENHMDASYKAISWIKDGCYGILMKGSCQTSDLLHCVVDKAKGITEGNMLSHIGVFQLPSYHKLIGLTDGGMIVAPEIDEKIKILENAKQVMVKLGCEIPKISILAATEKVNSKAKETVDAALIKAKNQNGEITGCIIEGPISYDLAMSKEAGEIKHFESPVAGDSDVLLVPSMVAGNLLAKSWTVSGGATMAGMVVGAKAPVVLVSRAASHKEKYLSILLASIGG